jgi:hypothetical protein
MPQLSHCYGLIDPVRESDRIRVFRDSDLEQIKKLHGGLGFGYTLPNLAESGDGFISKLVMTDEADVVRLAVLARITAEAYFIADPDFDTPAGRWRRARLLHRIFEMDLVQKGLDDCHAWLPPRVARGFSRRLSSLGWHPTAWTPLCLHLETSDGDETDGKG